MRGKTWLKVSRKLVRHSYELIHIPIYEMVYWGLCLHLFTND